LPKRPPFALPAASLILLLLATLLACAQFESRDRRFYYRAPWNYALRENLPNLDSEFNGVDFGHAHLYETLLVTGAKDVPAVEEKARHQTLRFIESKPILPPSEEAIAPTYMRLAWRAQNTFDEAHALHRATYDIYASDVPGKDGAIKAVLAYYQRSPYAITAQPLDHQKLDHMPFAQSFRRKFPLFNATIWAYHYLQIAAYDPLTSTADLEDKRTAIRPILATYHSYLQQPPVEWAFMPLTANYSPRFAARHPEVARIFDNLHMLHDTISDILVSDLFPTWTAKREEIYRVLDTYYLASADSTNPMILRVGDHRHAAPSPAPTPSQMDR
jgi:hypothetical protein